MRRRFSTRLVVQNIEGQLLTTWKFNIGLQRTALKFQRLLHLRIIAPTFFLALVGVLWNIFFHGRQIFRGPNLHIFDWKATEQRLLNAAVIPHFLASQKFVSHVFEIGVAEPTKRVLAFHFF